MVRNSQGFFQAIAVLKDVDEITTLAQRVYNSSSSFCMHPPLFTLIDGLMVMEAHWD